jgi:hypothetical protein
MELHFPLAILIHLLDLVFNNNSFVDHVLEVCIVRVEQLELNIIIHCHPALFQVCEFLLLQLHGATRHLVSTKMSLELIPHDGVDICMGVAVRLPPVGCRSIELVHGKKDFLMIHALGDHELLLNSFKPIFGFHWVLGLGECGRVIS